MTDWTARAHAHLEPHTRTDETDESPVSSAMAVSSVPEFLRNDVLHGLTEAACRAGDHWRDGHAARDQMLHDIEQTPRHLQADLLEHLQAAYPAGRTL